MTSNGEFLLSFKQRLNLIRWSHECCPDGNRSGGNDWKSRLAREAILKPGTVTKMTKPIAVDVKPPFNGETERRLCHHSDEVFLGFLGFEREATRRRELSSDANHLWMVRFVTAKCKEDFADICSDEGVPLHDNIRDGARKRSEEREQQRNLASVNWRTDESAYWFQSMDALLTPKMDQCPMHSTERRSSRDLFKVMVNGEKDAVATVVFSRPHSGVSHAITRLLPLCDGFDSYYRGGIHHIYTGALDDPKSVRERLRSQILGDVQKDRLKVRVLPTELRIADHLVSNDQMVVLHGASAIPDKWGARDFVDKLAKEIEKRSHTAIRKGVSRLILTVWEGSEFEYLNDHRARLHKYDPSVPFSDANKYFLRVFKYYKKLRGQTVEKSLETGPIAENSTQKRAEHHYKSIGSSRNRFASEMRFRAFCASDYQNPSPLDPTQGIWARTVDDLRDRIPEITDCISDIQADVRSYEPKGRANDLTLLRLVSTGLFFVTKAMLDQLSKHEGAKQCLPSENGELSLGLSDALRGRFVSYHDDDPWGVGTQERFSAPLLVRAIVQDDWMRWNAETRGPIHEAIGDVLQEMVFGRNYDVLGHELPYQAPWEDDGLVIALEGIRHYSRAAQSSIDSRKKVIMRKAMDLYDYELEPGTFTEEKEKQNRQSAGMLSRSKGLHSLKFEALCLLSSDGKGEEPPLGANPWEEFAFYREIGITLTRMLHPRKALIAFQKGLELPNISVFDRSYLLAHAITANLWAEDLSGAEDYMKMARAAEAEETDLDQKEQIRYRNDAREAMLELGKINRYAAQSKWKEILLQGLTPVSGDRGIAYFDSVMSTPIKLRKSPELLGELWAAIEHASHSAREKKLEHERLQIDIRKASIARLLGYPMAAEAILEHVGLDLARHSGAEILFREFQIESAETLLALERPRYAFVAYAWPAYQALRNRSAKLLIRKCRRLCRKLLLSAIPVTANEPKPDLKSNRFWREVEKTVDVNLYPFFSVDLLPTGEDVERYFQELAIEENRANYVKLLNE